MKKIAMLMLSVICMVVMSGCASLRSRTEILPNSYVETDIGGQQGYSKALAKIEFQENNYANVDSFMVVGWFYCNLCHAQKRETAT